MLDWSIMASLKANLARPAVRPPRTLRPASVRPTLRTDEPEGQQSPGVRIIDGEQVYSAA
jgi:hypothetical protein